jgi:hypothetical protein
MDKFDILSSVDVPAPIADGIAIMKSSGDVAVDSNIIDSCERVGVIFDHSSGKFLNNSIAKSKFGCVSQESEVEESGTLFSDNENNTNPDPNNPLPVANAEIPMPEPLKPAEK